MCFRFDCSVRRRLAVRRAPFPKMTRIRSLALIPGDLLIPGRIRFRLNPLISNPCPSVRRMMPRRDPHRSPYAKRSHRDDPPKDVTHIPMISYRQMICHRQPGIQRCLHLRPGAFGGGYRDRTLLRRMIGPGNFFFTHAQSLKCFSNTPLSRFRLSLKCHFTVPALIASSSAISRIEYPSI
jgi:hypothetical protein